MSIPSGERVSSDADHSGGIGVVELFPPEDVVPLAAGVLRMTLSGQGLDGGELRCFLRCGGGNLGMAKPMAPPPRGWARCLCSISLGSDPDSKGDRSPDPARSLGAARRAVARRAPRGRAGGWR